MKKIKSVKLANFIRVAVFLLMPLCLVCLMFVVMSTVLHSYLERQVEKSVDLLGTMASQQIQAKMDDLRNTAEFFRDGAVPESEMGEVMDRLLADPNRTSGGILKLNGEPVSGVNLHTSEYIGIQNTFRGMNVATYRVGEGFLFTAPIYNGENVKYALYEFFDPASLFSSYGKNFYDDQGELLIVDRSKESVYPITENVDTDYYYRSDFYSVYQELNRKMGQNTAAAVYHKNKDGRKYFFVAEMEQQNLYILGSISYQAVAGNLLSVSFISCIVYMILIFLLVVGTFSIINASVKIREGEELAEAKRLADMASKSKSDFLAKMSHELRTPINVILGMDEMILREENDADTRERAMDIKSAAQILLGLINDILDFSKIESGKMTIIEAEYDFVAMMRDFTLLTENRARQKSLHFEMNVQPELPSGLYGDDVHIRQVVTNLLTNAVKYTQDGKVILSVSGQKTEEDTVILHFEVTDTGMGIKPEDIEKLKVPYTRVDEEKNRNVEGTGLGMSIITNLLKLMGSQLLIESEYGKGSTFHFDLEQKIVDHTPVGDIRQRLTEMVRNYEYRVSFTAPKARILMVDDNSMNRSIFVSLLKKTQIMVMTVSSGEKCLEMVKNEHFDIIFMDHLMPGMDGVEALKALRAMEDGACKDVPVIALTANAFSGDCEKYKELGFDDFLAKPIVTERLEQMIREFLPPDYVEEVREEIAEDDSIGYYDEELSHPQIEGVNWDFAILHITDYDLLMHSLLEYYRNINMEKKDIEALKAAMDTDEGIKNYRYRVHALKSTSAMIGIMSVSELAKLLEKAAREEDRDRIELLHPILMEEMDLTKERLKPYMEPQEEEKTLLDDPEQIESLFDMLLFSMGEMDISGVDLVMEQLFKHSYEEKLQELMDSLKVKVDTLDYDAAERVIGEAIELLKK